MGDDKMPQLDGLPPACTLVATDGAARLARWRALSDARLSVRRIPDQLVVRYRSQRGVQQELEALVAAECECCSFADWEVTGDSEHVLLRIRSDAQGLAAIVGALGGVDLAPSIDLRPHVPRPANVLITRPSAERQIIAPCCSGLLRGCVTTTKFPTGAIVIVKAGEIFRL